MFSGYKIYVLVWVSVSILLGGLFQIQARENCVPSSEIKPSPALAFPDKLLAGKKGIERIKLLIQRGGTRQSSGRYSEAESDFILARDLASEMGRRELVLLGEHALGYLSFFQSDMDNARETLSRVLDQARSLGLTGLAASCAHRLGMVLAAAGRKEEGYLLYREALTLARKSGDPGMEAGILRNMALILSDDHGAMEALKEAWKLAEQVAAPEERADLLLGIGAGAMDRQTDQCRLLSFDVLNQARTLAVAHKWNRRQSQALGSLGQLYEALGQNEEALKATGRALEKAREIRAHDLLMVWEWQLGRILKAKGKHQKALSALRRSVYHSGILKKGHLNNPSHSFYGRLYAIHRDLADLLLSQTTHVSDEILRQKMLREAQEVVEGAKVSELRDFFRDPCLGALSHGIETLSKDTAVLYPVLLPDRLVLLLDAGGKLIQKNSSVQPDQLHHMTVEFARALRKRFDFRVLARQLYDVLIQPVSPVLEKYGIKTLVHVPDGVLRLLPLAALMKGDRFLVEEYALVTAPGLTLLDPAPFREQDKKSLVAGISEPGPVIYDLPPGVWQKLGGRGADIKPSIRGLALERVASTDFNDSVKSDPASEEQSHKVRKALALPGVEQEIRMLSGRLNAKVLFNDTFCLEGFSLELKENPYNIVHIASHGFFGGSPEQNFIMTYDRRLNMNDLESLIRPRQLADQPVELIVLSACQTAEGDEKSPLGLAGVVLKSGARSALGSLWPISDQASQEIFPLFYSFLEDNGEPSVKARALQMAQLTLMKKDIFRHPFYWAPFILVGNWL